MKKEEINQLSDEQLILEEKKRKPNVILVTILISTMVILAIGNTILNGIGIFTFFPLFFLPIFLKHYSINKLISQEKQNRKID